MQPECSSERLRSSELLRTASKSIPLVFFRSRRARRYILRVTDEGLARVTIPRGGSKYAARLFARQHVSWVQRQLHQLASRPRPVATLVPGDQILLRGRPMLLKLSACGTRISFGQESVGFVPAFTDCRAIIRQRLWALAKNEFVPRAFELAREHGVKIKKVMVRNQRTRWGSCSIHGAICLNWRLIQAPAFVQDYLIIHELMHLREMNHSERFWEHVASICPRYEDAERWLDAHDHLLRQG